MKNELISVVVPVYNVEKYLDKCIKSIVDQTYANLEVILVDDGSTDSSGRICDKYAESDKRVHVLHQKNGGRSAARNAGMDRASGDYLMFVDGDDWIDDNCLEEVYRFFENKTEMVVFRERRIYVDKVEDNGSDKYMKFLGNEPLEFYVNGYKDFQVYNSVCGKLYRNSLIQNIRFEEGRYYEDIMFTTRVYAACRDCVYLDKAYYNYNIATDSSITYMGVNELTFRDEIPIFYEKELFLKNIGRKDLAERYSFFRYQRLISYYEECMRKREFVYAKRIAGIIKTDKPVIRKIVKKEYVSGYYIIYLRLFIMNPKFAFVFGNLFKKTVQLRKCLYSRKLGGQQIEAD